MPNQTTKEVAEAALAAKYPPGSAAKLDAIAALAANLVFYELHGTGEILALCRITEPELRAVKERPLFKAEIKRLEAKAAGGPK